MHTHLKSDPGWCELCYVGYQLAGKNPTLLWEQVHFIPLASFAFCKGWNLSSISLVNRLKY